MSIETVLSKGIQQKLIKKNLPKGDSGAAVGKLAICINLISCTSVDCVWLSQQHWCFWRRNVPSLDIEAGCRNTQAMFERTVARLQAENHVSENRTRCS